MAQQTDNNIEQGMKAAFDYFDKVSSFAKSQPVNEVKQTAVEWLKQQYIERGDTLPSGVFEQAKQMEKEQMFEFTKKHHIIGEHSRKFYTEEFEQYYNETYKK